jgi:hypothetical protein
MFSDLRLSDIFQRALLSSFLPGQPKVSAQVFLFCLNVAEIVIVMTRIMIVLHFDKF